MKPDVDAHTTLSPTSESVDDGELFAVNNIFLIMTCNRWHNHANVTFITFAWKGVCWRYITCFLFVFLNLLFYLWFWVPFLWLDINCPEMWIYDELSNTNTVFASDILTPPPFPKSPFCHTDSSSYGPSLSDSKHCVCLSGFSLMSLDIIISASSILLQIAKFDSLWFYS